MSDDHKAALAEGREQGRIVRDYLNAISTPKRRGRKVPVPKMREELAAIPAQMAEADPLGRLGLAQRAVDLERRIAEAEAEDAPVDLSDLEAKFIAAAGPYSERKGLTRDAWRAVGVPPKVLRAAGIT